VSEAKIPKTGLRPSNAGIIHSIGDVEGFIALVSTAVLLLMPSSPPLTQGFLTVAVATLFGLGFMFGLGAVRFGGKRGRVTGGVALLVLSVLLAVLVVHGIMNWGRIRSYWG
jgi:hypothetical protein